MPYNPTPEETQSFPGPFLALVIDLADKHRVTITSVVSQSDISQDAKDKKFVKELSVDGGWCQAIATGWLMIQSQLESDQDAGAAARRWAEMSNPTKGHTSFKAIQKMQASCHLRYVSILDQKKVELDVRQAKADKFKSQANPPGYLFYANPYNWISKPQWNEDIVKEFREFADQEEKKYFAALIGWPDGQRVTVDSRIPPGTSPARLLTEHLGPGNQLILLSKDAQGYWSHNIRHGLAATLSSGTALTFMDPNGCVWSGTPEDVAAMYEEYAKATGFANWFEGANWKIVRYNPAATEG